jgi:pimeloyl-ACP methyl ester carboxylesterase
LSSGLSPHRSKPALSQAIADRIEGARLECIPGAGHFVMIEDAPAFNKALSDFVRGLP